MSEFLLELFSEEIPARMQAQACENLQRLMSDRLQAANLDFGQIQGFVTPRRLVLVIDGLPQKQPDISEERRGPRADAPEKAIAGFKGSLPDGAVISSRDEKKGTFLYAQIAQAGQTTSALLADMVEDVIRSFPWPKSMRTGTTELRWVRPLLSILALFDGAVVPVEVDGLRAGRQTSGHRFLSPAPFEVTDFSDYRQKLAKAHVVLDANDRQTLIADRAAELAQKSGLQLIEDQDLLLENAGLTEQPVPYLGHFDESFLTVPEEVLITSMKVHQKFFSLRDPKTGRLAPNFLCVANLNASDGGAAILNGNERVLSARLADARFFWEQDLKQKLDDRLPALEDIVFHEKLGSLAERVRRIEGLAVHLAETYVSDADVDHVRRAARLCKADLVSGMVGEFPELQGVMGYYYAKAQGEPDEVACAIKDHYAPKGPGDICPSAPVSICVSLAEKLDTLIGFFGIGEKPTGSKDPFALRRAALGVIRLILENGLRIKLSHIPGFSDALLSFFADRLKVQQREKGVRYDLIDAVFSLGHEDDLVRLLARVDALEDFLRTDDGANLHAGYKRARNILKIEGKRDKTADWGAVDPALLTLSQEKQLFEKIGAATGEVDKALQVEDFADAMRALSRLRAPIDAFFDHVTVNAQDANLRRNRLALLAEIRNVTHHLADLSKVEA